MNVKSDKLKQLQKKTNNKKSREKRRKSEVEKSPKVDTNVLTENLKSTIHILQIQKHVLSQMENDQMKREENRTTIPTREG